MAFIFPNLFEQTRGAQEAQNLISQRTQNFNDYHVARTNEIGYLQARQKFDQDLDFQNQYSALRREGISPQQALFAVGQTANNPYVSAQAYSQQRATTDLLAPIAADAASKGDYRFAAQLSDPGGGNLFDTQARGAAAVNQLLPLFGSTGVGRMLNQAGAAQGYNVAQQAAPTDALLAQQMQAYQRQNAQLQAQLHAGNVAAQQAATVPTATGGANPFLIPAPPQTQLVPLPAAPQEVFDTPAVQANPRAAGYNNQPAPPEPFNFFTRDPGPSNGTNARRFNSPNPTLNPLYAPTRFGRAPHG